MRAPRAIRLALVLAVLIASLGIATGATAATPTGTIKLNPATVQVDNGGTFTVKVISDTAVPVSAVSASITFNKAILQVTSITRSAAWASAPLFLAGDAPAIATANKKGKLQNVAASFFPPTNVPAGAQEFISVEFKAIACGTVKMEMPQGRVDSTLLDGREKTYGSTVKIKTSGATVTVCQGAAGASASLDPNVSAAPVESGAVLAPESLDPNASPSDAVPVESTPVGGGVVGAPSPVPSAMPTTVDPNAVSTTTSEQSGWLTFAMAALALAAAGLAALILVLTIVAIAAAAIGTVVVFRAWRRTTARDAEEAFAEEAAEDIDATQVEDAAGTLEDLSPEPAAPSRRVERPIPVVNP